MLNITIKTIPHKEQRYETCGDWWEDKESIQIRVSDLGDPVMEWLIAEHEINEFLMCKRDGISEEQVNRFDINFENLRINKPGIIGDQEPGNMVSAPYYNQHQSATRIEKLSAIEHKVNWEEYDKKVNEL